MMFPKFACDPRGEGLLKGYYAKEEGYAKKGKNSKWEGFRV